MTEEEVELEAEAEVEEETAEASAEEETTEEAAVEEEPEAEETVGASSWKFSGQEAKREIKREDTRRQSDNRPVLWLKDGEEKDVRFRDEDPLAVIYMHSMKDGKRYPTFTCKGKGCLFCKNGVQKKQVIIYELIDLDGYEKDGKKVRNVPRFYEANSSRHKQLDKIAAMKKLTIRNIRMSREGSKRKTTYTFVPHDPSKLDPKVLASKRLKPDFDKYYAPPSDDRAMEILQRLGGADMESDDVDD